MNIHFDRLKEIFGNNTRLLYTDTDSLKVLIKNTNSYELDDEAKKIASKVILNNWHISSEFVTLCFAK